jgi:hypothetical protein
MPLIEIIADDRHFFVCSETLDNDPTFVITQMVHSKLPCTYCTYVEKIDNYTYRIDVDSVVLETIIKTLRGVTKPSYNSDIENILFVRNSTTNTQDTVMEPHHFQKNLEEHSLSKPQDLKSVPNSEFDFSVNNESSSDRSHIDLDVLGKNIDQLNQLNQPDQLNQLNQPDQLNQLNQPDQLNQLNQPDQLDQSNIQYAIRPSIFRKPNESEKKPRNYVDFSVMSDKYDKNGTLNDLLDNSTKSCSDLGLSSNKFEDNVKRSNITSKQGKTFSNTLASPAIRSLQRGNTLQSNLLAEPCSGNTSSYRDTFSIPYHSSETQNYEVPRGHHIFKSRKIEIDTSEGTK